MCTDLEGKKGGVTFGQGRIVTSHATPRDPQKQGDNITIGNQLSPDSSLIFHHAPWDVSSASPYQFIPSAQVSKPRARGKTGDARTLFQVP